MASIHIKTILCLYQSTLKEELAIYTATSLVFRSEETFT